MREVLAYSVMGGPNCLSANILQYTTFCLCASSSREQRMRVQCARSCRSLCSSSPAYSHSPPTPSANLCCLHVAHSSHMQRWGRSIVCARYIHNFSYTLMHSLLSRSPLYYYYRLHFYLFPPPLPSFPSFPHRSAEIGIYN